MMSFLKRTCFLVGFIFSGIIFLPRVAVAQIAFEVITEEPEYTFGEVISFNAALNSDELIDEVLLFIQSSDDSDLQVHVVSIDNFGNLSTDVDLREFPLIAFSNPQYWYQIRSVDGAIYTSPRNSFIYADNRYQWRTISGDPFTIHWHRGDLAFGEEGLNVALEGFRNTQDLLEVFFPNSLDIYVYETPQAMQAALPKDSQDWIAGHADPDQGVIMHTHMQIYLLGLMRDWLHWLNCTQIQSIRFWWRMHLSQITFYLLTGCASHFPMIPKAFSWRMPNPHPSRSFFSSNMGNRDSTGYWQPMRPV
jgi:hypothetical protein